MAFDPSLFNPFENRLQIPIYWLPCIVLSGQVMGIVAMFANYYINIDNLYRISKNTVRKKEMDILKRAKWAHPRRYFYIIKCQFKSLTELPDTVIDTIIIYLIMMSLSSVIDDNTDEHKNDMSDVDHESVHSQSVEVDIDKDENQKNEISLLLFKDEWYKARVYGLNNTSKRIWKSVYMFCYVWLICRSILWSASFMILMYEYHLMRPSHSLVQNYILFVWILAYFQPHWLHLYCVFELIAIRCGAEMEMKQVIQYELYDGIRFRGTYTLKQRFVFSLVQSFQMLPLVWQLPNIVCCCSMILFLLTALIPLGIPLACCYTPLWTPYGAFVKYIIDQWIMDPHPNRMFSFVVILAATSMVYLIWIIFSVIMTASVYCLYMSSFDWLGCLVGGFKIQDTLVLPQSDDWRMIIVLLGMIF